MKISFDPLGNRMRYTAWNTKQTQTSFTFGRFFSPDPFVQAPDFTQNYNRYSYCMNNPVMFSDPTGEVFVIDDAIIVGAMIGAFFGGIRADQKGESFLGGMIKGAFLAVWEVP